MKMPIIRSQFRKIRKVVNLSYRQFRYSALYAMILRNGGRPVVGIIIRLITAMGGRPSWRIATSVKLLLSQFSSIATKQGAPGLVKFLKSCSVALQQSICGHKPTGLSPRISLTNTGIPRILPPHWRRFIRKFTFLYIRLSLTLFSLYRDISYPGKFKINTISDPYSGSISAIESINSFIPLFVRYFVQDKIKLPLNVHNRRDWLQGRFSYFPISKSAPMVSKEKYTISTNPIVMIRTAMAFSDAQLQDWQVLFRLVTNNQYRLKECKDSSWPYFKTSDAFDALCFVRGVNTWLRPFEVLRPKMEYIGKLGTKEEAAGKIRVFAMVDPWTQMVLKPFHDLLQDILACHKRVDGTFDQLRPLKRAWSFNQLYSMDLSSATDRLPLAIQVPLFQAIFQLSKAESESWGNLLVKRDYLLPKTYKTKGFIRYSVGQPMGALSSWDMLAITHHLLVNVAAWKSGLPRHCLFSNYAILGDDIVIFDRRVAKTYHRLLTSLGVECNLNKSILSHKGIGLEFAKKTMVKGTDVSPTPLKELSAALSSPSELISYSRKYSLSFSQTLKVGGFGYRVLGNLSKPFVKLNSKVRSLIVSLAIVDPDKIESFFAHTKLPYDVMSRVNRKFVENYYYSSYINYHTVIRSLSDISYWWPSRTIVQEPGPISRYADFLFEKVYVEYRDRVLIQLAELDIMYKKLRPSSDSPFVLLRNIITIEAEVAKLSNVSFFLSPDRSTPDVRPTPLPRLYRLKDQWNRLISSISREMKESSNAGPDMESSIIPFRVLRTISLRRITKFVSYQLRSRLIWFSSFTTLISICVFLKGLQPVFEIVVSMVGIISLLWSVNESFPVDTWVPSWVWSALSWVGNILTHVVELWISLGVVVTFCKWSIISPFIRAEIWAYDVGLHSVWDVLLGISRLVNRLIYDTAIGAITSVPDIVAHQPISWNIIMGMIGGQLFIWLIRWFFS